MTATSFGEHSSRAADFSLNRFAVSIACMLYLLGYAGYSFGESMALLRYVIYGVPVVLAASLLLEGKPTANNVAVAFLLAYVFFAPLGYLIGVKETDLFFNNFVIMILILFSFVPKIEVQIEQIRLVFLCSGAYFFLAYWLTDQAGIRLLEMLKNGSVSGLEQGYDNNEGGLTGPLYAVFFYAIAAKIEFFLALFMSILGGKRIGILAIFGGLAAGLLLNKRAALMKRRNRFIFLLATLGIINIAASNTIYISQYLHGQLRTDVSIEEVMLGRYAIAFEMTRSIDQRSALESLLGFGPGAASDLALRVTGGTLKEPHNDWLRILFDYGILGSMAATALIALLFSASAIASVIAIASGILMTTDNVILYLYYQFPVVLMLGYSKIREAGVQ
jgi:hypothetical protein